jgi:NAD(P)-dependent dehydrogenase (short-subunit alcohol dehydrogenase family)
MTLSVVVTGASTGIGKATALRLAVSGWQVFAGVRSDKDGDQLSREGGQQLTPIHLDVTEWKSIAHSVELVSEVTGSDGLGALVNNAGIGRGGPVEYLSLEDWRLQLEVGVVGQVAVTKAFLPLLRAARGRVVFLGSISGRMSSPLLAPYCAAKHALEAIAESLRHELRSARIKVALIEPGAVRTPLWDKARGAMDGAEHPWPAEALDRYGELFAASRRMIEHQAAAGIPAERVAAVIESALTSPRPPARQLVGRDAEAVGILTRLLPDRLRDLLQAKIGGY